jgi:hypothetical protein
MSSCRIVDEPEKKFVPIKLEIIIDSADDLMEIWHRMNICGNDVRVATNSPQSFPSLPKMSSKIYDALEDVAIFYKELKAGR